MFPSSPRRISGSVSRSPFVPSSSTAVMIIPGVQKPHWSAWRSQNACWSGWSSPPCARPSIVVISLPSAWTASKVHDFTACPSRWIVQAPQSDVSQPIFVPVSPRSSRRKSTSSVRGSTSASCRTPLTVSAIGITSPPLRRALPRTCAGSRDRRARSTRTSRDTRITASLCRPVDAARPCRRGYATSVAIATSYDGRVRFGSVEEVERALGAESYLPDRGLATAVYLAVTMQRPLLLEGEAGVGKTEVGKTLARVLGAELIRLECGVVDRRGRPRRRRVRGVPARGALRLQRDRPRAGDDHVERAAGRRRHLEPHARAARRAQAPLSLPLDRL